jgi:AcrR family transcriptional regulator
MAQSSTLRKAEANERRSHESRRSEAERKLFDAAVRMVAVDGLERFTLADVGEAAGYSRGLPAHYFGSKEGLVAALANRIVGGFGIGLIRVETHRPGFDRLLGTVAFYFDSAMRDPETTRTLLAILGAAITDKSLRKKIAALNARSAEALRADIEAGRKEGTIARSIDPRTQATLILSSLRGAVAQWLTDPEHVDLKALKSAYIASLKRMLAP